jgi:hypothetical protein
MYRYYEEPFRFPGTNQRPKSEQPTLEVKFSSYVSNQYKGVHGSAVCRFDKSRSVTTMRREDDKIDVANHENRAVIETNWRPYTHYRGPLLPVNKSLILHENP